MRLFAYSFKIQYFLKACFMSLTEYLYQQCLRIHNLITGSTAKRLTVLIIDEKIKELRQQPYDFTNRIAELEQMKEHVSLS